jgi:hypothetical protein
MWPSPWNPALKANGGFMVQALKGKPNTSLRCDLAPDSAFPSDQDRNDNTCLQPEVAQRRIWSRRGAWGRRRKSRSRSLPRVRCDLHDRGGASGRWRLVADMSAAQATRCTRRGFHDEPAHCVDLVLVTSGECDMASVSSEERSGDKRAG